MDDVKNQSETGPFSFSGEGAANDEEMKSIQSVLQDSQPEPEPTADEESESSYVVSEWEVRAILTYGFEAGHLFTGHEHWKATDKELDAVVPGVTRLINRTTFLSAAVGRVSEYSDWASLGHLFWMVLRRYLASRQIWAEVKAKEGQDNAENGLPEPIHNNFGAIPNHS